MYDNSNGVGYLLWTSRNQTKNMPVLFDGLVKDFCLESIEAAEESIERKQIRGDIQNESLL